MTDYVELREFFKTFNEGSFDEGKTLIEFIDSSIDLFTIPELRNINQQLSEYLASKPTEAELQTFWRTSNKLVSFGNDRSLRLFLNMALRRLKFRSSRQ